MIFQPSISETPNIYSVYLANISSQKYSRVISLSESFYLNTFDIEAISKPTLLSCVVVLCCLLLVSELVTFYLIFFIIFLVRFRLLNDHLWEKAAHSVDHMFSLYFDYL